jgi:hypothetical protein
MDGFCGAFSAEMPKDDVAFDDLIAFFLKVASQLHTEAI